MLVIFYYHRLLAVTVWFSNILQVVRSDRKRLPVCITYEHNIGSTTIYVRELLRR